MAEINVEDTGKVIEIDLDNDEDSYIYYSICDYSEAILSKIGSINKNIRDICKICGSKEDDTEQKEPLVATQVLDSSQPEVLETSKRSSTVSVNKRDPKKARVDPSQTDVTSHRIKRIDSKAFGAFLGKQTSTIKDVNREIILNLQSLSENNPREITPSRQPSRKISRQPSLTMVQGDVLRYINYGGRLLVVLPIPNDRDSDQIIFNKNGTWCPNGGIGPSYPKSKKCPFYKSTGTSNTGIGANFPNMWFPFFRIKTSIPGGDRSSSEMSRGWVYKAWGLQSVRQLRQRLHQRFSEEIPAPPEKNETSDFFYCFLEKFSHWWQIQLSLQLPIEQGETLWDTDPILINFKNIVLTYDYDHFASPYFKPRKNEHKQYSLDSVASQIHLESSKTNGQDTIPEQINLWLRGDALKSDKSNPLCIEDSEDQ